MTPRPTLANALSLLRPVVALPAAWCVIEGQWPAAGGLLAVAVLSDLADGPIARHRGEDSTLGGLLDHGCDAIFVTIVLSALAIVAGVPPLLPVLVVVSFAQYVADSNALSGQRLRTNKLGRCNGIAYFILPAACIVPEALAPGWVDKNWITAASWLLIASTLISMLDRLWTFLTLKRTT